MPNQYQYQYHPTGELLLALGKGISKVNINNIFQFHSCNELVKPYRIYIRLKGYCSIGKITFHF